MLCAAILWRSQTEELCLALQNHVLLSLSLELPLKCICICCTSICGSVLVWHLFTPQVMQFMLNAAGPSTHVCPFAYELMFTRVRLFHIIVRLTILDPTQKALSDPHSHQSEEF